MIEESEERLTEAQIEQLLDIIATTLPGGDTAEDEEGMETEDVIPEGDWHWVQLATTLPGGDTAEDEEGMETEDVIPEGEWHWV